MFIGANNQVDREGLRLFVLGQLTLFRQIAQETCVDKRAFWDISEQQAKKTLFGKESEMVGLVIRQIIYLPNYIQMWIDTAVDTTERFDFFVLTKAHELKSGDQEHDYFWAMQIRHDQMVALVNVLDMLLKKIKVWVSDIPQNMFDDPVFLGLIAVNIEDQVYLEAEKVYKERQRYVDSNPR